MGVEQAILHNEPVGKAEAAARRAARRRHHPSEDGQVHLLRLLEAQGGKHR